MMQMSRALDDRLCRSYPALYAQRNGDPSHTSMCWGFQTGDGWFGIIDALSEVLTAQSEPDEKRHLVAVQVKQKFGGLRFHVEAEQHVRPALLMAEELSFRICEATGSPGRLCRTSRQQLVTLASSKEVNQRESADVVAVDRGKDLLTNNILTPAPGFSAEEIAQWRPDVLLGPINVPGGWIDLSDALLLLVQKSNRDTQNVGSFLSVQRIWVDGNRLRVAWTRGNARAELLSKISSALAQRIDPTSGAMTPPCVAGASSPVPLASRE
jgi:hypothetical protein